MTLEKSDVFSQIRNDPKEEQGHTPSKECCLYASFFNVHEWARTCRLIRTCMYIVQVDPHVHLCAHGSWCLALQLV